MRSRMRRRGLPKPNSSKSKMGVIGELTLHLVIKTRKFNRHNFLDLAVTSVLSPVLIFEWT